MPQTGESAGDDTLGIVRLRTSPTPSVNASDGEKRSLLGGSDKARPQSLANYLGLLTHYGVLEGFHGQAQINRKLAPLLAALHEVIAGGSAHVHVRLAGDERVVARLADTLGRTAWAISEIDGSESITASGKIYLREWIAAGSLAQREDAATLLDGLHHVLAGGAIDVRVLRVGEPSIVAILDRTLEAAVSEWNELPASAAKLSCF